MFRICVSCREQSLWATQSQYTVLVALNTVRWRCDTNLVQPYTWCHSMTPPQPRRQSIIIATRLRHAQHFSESLESPVQLKGGSNLRLKVSNDNTHTVSHISFGLQNLTGAGQSSSEILYFDRWRETANFAIFANLNQPSWQTNLYSAPISHLYWRTRILGMS